LSNTYEQRYREILISLRKIIQATDLHSRSLSKKFGLTGPQLVILEEVSNHEPISVTGLAKSISLSQATVTDIINRLVKKDYINKRKSEKDKRQVRKYRFPKKGQPFSIKRRLPFRKHLSIDSPTWPIGSN